MFVRKKKYPSGNIGVIVVEKIGGKMKELATIGVAYSENEVESLVNEAKVWISKEEARRHPQLDLYGEERKACEREREEVRRVLSQVSNILLNGCVLTITTIMTGTESFSNVTKKRTCTIINAFFLIFSKVIQII